MFVKNYSNNDLKLSLKGNSITLTANDVTYVPDGLITIAELETMFGQLNVGQVATGTAESLMNNQFKAETGKLYCTDGSVGLGTPRCFIGGGSVSVYGSDSESVPTATSDMALPEANEDVDGVRVFGALPRYIAFSGSATEIIVTNCKLTEVGDIS